MWGKFSVTNQENVFPFTRTALHYWTPFMAGTMEVYALWHQIMHPFPMHAVSCLSLEQSHSSRCAQSWRTAHLAPQSGRRRGRRSFLEIDYLLSSSEVQRKTFFYFSTMTCTEEAQSFVDKFNEEYEKKHQAFEEQFWGTKVRQPRLRRDDACSRARVSPRPLQGIVLPSLSLGLSHYQQQQWSAQT